MYCQSDNPPGITVIQYVACRHGTRKDTKTIHSFWCQAFNVTNRIVHSITISKIDKISNFFTFTLNKTFVDMQRDENIM